jgi:hypothetical protein
MNKQEGIAIAQNGTAKAFCYGAMVSVAESKK